MLTCLDFDSAIEIINKLSIPNHFDPDEGGDLIGAQIEDIGLKARIEQGVSKLVIIPTDYNYVIKIPFNGFFDYVWNDEAGECDYDNLVFYYYLNACAPDTSDYCWDELIRINKAYDAGFEKLFPATAFVKEINGHRFYIQEKVRVARDFKPTGISENSRQKAETLTNYYKNCDDTWRAAVIEYYGEIYWKSFCDWNYINCIDMLSDMHSSNYGYDMNGYPVILDVSGFRD